ncbi:MAG: type II toxin-antitoxin system VapC family toxin [Syntrophobacteraceae bacterium]
MKPKIYLETTVISYLVAKPSRDLVVAAHQQITQEWWETRRQGFDVFISELVVREAGAGDTAAAQRRLDALQEIPLLELNEEALYLALELVAKGPIPEKAKEDALHIALAATHGMDYLLTWNCRHIANAEIRSGVAAVCITQGYDDLVICTPEELMGD